jgi:hypothetical protein
MFCEWVVVTYEKVLFRLKKNGPALSVICGDSVINAGQLVLQMSDVQKQLFPNPGGIWE